MLHTKFSEIGPPVLELKIFLRVFTIYEYGGHFGHVTSIMFMDFHFLVPHWPSKGIRRFAGIYVYCRCFIRLFY